MISVFILFRAASSLISDEFSLNSLEMGSPCLPHSVFNVTQFLIPAYNSIVDNFIETNMTGNFMQTIYVQDLLIGTNFERKSWTYETILINKTFVKNQNSYFVVNKKNGLLPGRYLMQEWLTNTDSKGNQVHLSCWQIEYELIA